MQISGSFAQPGADDWNDEAGAAPTPAAPAAEPTQTANAGEDDNWWGKLLPDNPLLQKTSPTDAAAQAAAMDKLTKVNCVFIVYFGSSPSCPLTTR